MTSLLLSMSFAIAGPIGSINLIPGETPIYTEIDFIPLVFLNENGGRVLFDDPYGIWTSGDITSREGNYAFTGEQVQWKVLVWDKNGVPEKIHDVFAGWSEQTNGPLAPESQANCEYLGPVSEDSLISQGYSEVRRTGDQEPQVNGNANTMGEYLCTLTVEPTAHGQKWMGIKALDVDMNEGVMEEAESWFLNPTMDIGISGTVNFGELGPSERGTSTISVKNNAEQDSGMEVVFRISGTDFYDPSSSGALCPTSNVMSLTNFEYSANQGGHSKAWDTIPYSNAVQDSEEILPNGVTTSPGAELSLHLALEIPNVCNGQFTDGNINLWAVAV